MAATHRERIFQDSCHLGRVRSLSNSHLSQKTIMIRPRAAAKGPLGSTGAWTLRNSASHRGKQKGRKPRHKVDFFFVLVSVPAPRRKRSSEWDDFKGTARRRGPEAPVHLSRSYRGRVRELSTWHVLVIESRSRSLPGLCILSMPPSSILAGCTC